MRTLTLTIVAMIALAGLVMQTPTDRTITCQEQIPGGWFYLEYCTTPGVALSHRASQPGVQVAQEH